jgi:hypothetical protein
MYSLDLQGTLEKFGSDWVVGGSPPLLERMPGHRGRLIVFENKPVSSTTSPSDPPGDLDLESLMSDAGSLLSQFETLQKAMKDKS